VCELDRAGDTRAEANAVVRAGYVVVHGLGDRYDLDTLLVEACCITQRVVPADGDQKIDPEKLEMLEDLRREVVDLVGVLVLHAHWDDGFG
jgi:hypothetical protein